MLALLVVAANTPRAPLQCANQETVDQTGTNCENEHTRKRSKRTHIVIAQDV